MRLGDELNKGVLIRGLFVHGRWLRLCACAELEPKRLSPRVAYVHSAHRAHSPYQREREARYKAELNHPKGAFSVERRGWHSCSPPDGEM